MKGKPIKVAVVVDEYFGGAGTAYGGFGFAARHIVCRYLPSELFQFEVLLQKRKKIWHFLPKTNLIDGVNVISPPSKAWLPFWLYCKNYDIYLTIEVTHDIVRYDRRRRKRVIHWIRDPRPWYVWRRISSMAWVKEHCYFNLSLYSFVNKLFRRGQLKFISKGPSLNNYAKDLYMLPDDIPIDIVPDPMPVNPKSHIAEYPKDNLIVFLGRLESQKRAWLFCEVALRLPHYNFVVIGKTYRHNSENMASIEKYINGKVNNLSFVGHLEDEEKYEYLRRAKILLNTSIWEGIPISFWEALSVGTLIVSSVNPDKLPERFGAYVGEVAGDGFDKIDLFVSAIADLMRDEERREKLAQEAIAYIKEFHSIEAFRETMHDLLHNEALISRRRV